MDLTFSFETRGKPKNTCGLSYRSQLGMFFFVLVESSVSYPHHFTRCPSFPTHHTFQSTYSFSFGHVPTRALRCLPVCCLPVDVCTVFHAYLVALLLYPILLLYPTRVAISYTHVLLFNLLMHPWIQHRTTDLEYLQHCCCTRAYIRHPPSHGAAGCCCI